MGAYAHAPSCPTELTSFDRLAFGDFRLKGESMLLYFPLFLILYWILEMIFFPNFWARYRKFWKDLDFKDF